MISLCGVPGAQLFLCDAKFSLTNKLYWLGALVFAGVPSLLKRPKACNCPLQELHTCKESCKAATRALQQYSKNKASAIAVDAQMLLIGQCLLCLVCTVRQGEGRRQSLSAQML